jgi:hypothetical protein
VVVNFLGAVASAGLFYLVAVALWKKKEKK